MEYGVAVGEYLGRAGLSPASRRVYRISLDGWAWPLVGRATPDGQRRRGAVPPVVPLALLDDPGTPGRLADAFEARAAVTDGRTVNRELSALRSAAGWWREQGWIRADPVAGLRLRAPGAPEEPLLPEQAAAVFRLPVSLREHALWRLLRDSGAPAAEILALDADRLDLTRHQLRSGELIRWREPTSQALGWLLAGRAAGPVFLTGRRAPSGIPPADVCRVTGRGRLSYRRAAELFTAATRPLDPSGRGWTLHQLTRPRH